MRIERRAKAVLTDIEGTTGSIAFVHDVLFPYAAANLDAYVERHAGEPHVEAILRDAAREAEIEPGDRTRILAQLHAWIASDAKVTPLKTLQGYIWADGYADGEIKGHVYADAAEQLHVWDGRGVRLYVYSSGSVAAQKLIFGHSVEGDLTPLFAAYFDTATGPKRDAASYRTIARELAVDPHDVIFLSDSEPELDAAREAGMQTVQLARENDGTIPSARHDVARSFFDIDVTLSTTR